MNKFYTAIIAAISTVLIFSVGCCKKPSDPTVIRVAASITPHAEILEYAKPILAEHNVELDIVEFDDYVMPNTGVEDGSLDANYFQHQPYLDDFNAEQGTHLVSVATVHYEPMGLYPGKSASVDEIKQG